MIEAGIVAVSILISTWWLSRTVGIQAARQDASRTAQTAAFQNMRTGLEATILTAADDTREVLRALVTAVGDQHHADLITELAAALTAEMTAVTSRQAAMDAHWTDLSTRVERNGAGRMLRLPG